MYRETASADWRPTLPGDRPMPRCPPEGKRATGEHLLWPTIADQLFYTDAVTVGGHHVEFGENTFAPIDMTIGPEDPRPLVELVATLGRDRIPWRSSFILEGCGPAAMSMKKIAAQFLAMFPGNEDLVRAFDMLAGQRREENHIAVKLRASFATWAPVEDHARLRRKRVDARPAGRGPGATAKQRRSSAIRSTPP